MYRMIYMGGYNPRIFEEILNFKNIELCGCILDYTLSNEEVEETKNKMKEANIKEVYIDDIPSIKPDMIFLCDYTKILKTSYLDEYLFVNIHAGILPKWRGFNANCWAMLNGDLRIGYTIHRVREGLDAGEIFTIIDIMLEKDESYALGRERIKDCLCERLEEIFCGIISGEIEPKIQCEDNIVYNCKLRKTDGDIRNWNRPTSYIYGLYKVFGVAPLGTGIRIYIKEKEYSVLKMEEASEITKSVGIPGAVINAYPDGSVLIKTEDTAVRIIELGDVNGNKVSPREILKIGMRL